MVKKNFQLRLGKIEGQVRGIGRMIEEGRSCADLMIQLRAVRAALRAVEDQLVGDHIAELIEGELDSAPLSERRRRIDELLAALWQASAAEADVPG
ncbi:MAG: metal-sensitive transcriptional regulator [Geminicoccaceae bacterium]